MPSSSSSSSAAAGAGVAAGAPGSVKDVTDLVLRGKVFALNNLKTTDAVNVFQGGPSLVCRSDADNQLILAVPFAQAVRLSAVSVGAPRGGEAPATLKLFVNRPALGFEDVGDVEPAQSFALAAADLEEGAAPLKLKVARFSSVDQLHVFVEGAPESDTVVLGSLKFFGTTVQGSGADWSQLKKGEHDHDH